MEFELDGYRPAVRPGIPDWGTSLSTERGQMTGVTCPVVECLLGDKLTAFAPNTTGVQYRLGKDIEMAKQLFDVGTLFDVNLICKTFEWTVTKELAYRRMPELTPSDVLLDSFQTACLVGTRGAIAGGEYAELVSGIKKLAAFVYSMTFTIDTAIVCASKVAYLAGLILKQTSGIARFQTNIDISSWIISNPEYAKLNKIKKTSPEAFFYFYQALKLL